MDSLIWTIGLTSDGNGTFPLPEEKLKMKVLESLMLEAGLAVTWIPFIAESKQKRKDSHSHLTN